MYIKKILMLASGGGSNVIAILEHFKNNKNVQCVAVITNNKQAGVILKVEPYAIQTIYIPNMDWLNITATQKIQTLNPDLIVLAGFLKKIPESLVALYPNKIINIHPALLPKFGGKGMYGMHVHNAVKNAAETQTGPTVHYVNEHYDEGNIIAQKIVQIEPTDTVLDISNKVLVAEHQLYPTVIQQLLNR